MGCRQSTPVDAPAAPPVADAPASVPAPASNAAPSAPAEKKSAEGSEVPKSTQAAEPDAAPTGKSADRFAITGHSIFESGVVYYTIALTEETDGAAVQKRFREFKALHQALAKLEGGATLPALPDSGVRSVLKGRHNAELIQAREVQLAALLNSIADRPALADASEFRQFVAPASA